jgi:hypothetical protein
MAASVRHRKDDRTINGVVAARGLTECPYAAPSSTPAQHSRLEALRCVKRYIAREVYSLIRQRGREVA